MSIAAIATAYDSPPRAVALQRAAESRADQTSSNSSDSSRSEAASRGRRQPLMDAMLDASGLRARSSKDEPIEKAAPTADALKSDSGAADEAVARFAHALMGDLRQLDGGSDAGNWSDLSSRVGALAAKASAEPAAEVEVPTQPNPLTPTSAAVHLMQVPSSHLLEAYAALRQALPRVDGASEPSNDRADLAQFLGRMSQSLAPQDAVNGLGNLLDARA